MTGKVLLGRAVVLAATAGLFAAPGCAAAHRMADVLDEFVALYAPMQAALAADSVEKVKENAAKIAAAAAEYADHSPDKAQFETLGVAAKGMTASNIEELREQFKALSRALAQLVEKQAVAGHGIFYCSMADAYWVQKTGDVANPYYGKFMLRCGGEVKKVEG